MTLYRAYNKAYFKFLENLLHKGFLSIKIRPLLISLVYGYLNFDELIKKYI